MGAVKVMLSEVSLKDREPHNSRLFVDLCENIHIHFREYRLVFSLPEYFEFIDIVNKSTEDVRNYLAQNPDYEEERYKTTLMVAGGNSRQIKFLQKSPQPNKSSYFDNSLRIELQEEYVTDEIHVHYRDLRLALNRENFRDIARAFIEADQRLTEFERTYTYERQHHRDRSIASWDQPAKVAACDTPIMGAKELAVEELHSPWHANILSDWNPDPKVIEALRASIRKGSRLAPVVVIPRPDGQGYTIIDGHHRVRAALEEGRTTVGSVVLDGVSYEDTSSLRRAEMLLKEFDKLSGYRFRVSEFFRSYLAYSLNDYYRDQFYHAIKAPSLIYRLLKACKAALLKLPLPSPVRVSLAGISGSKKYWR